MMRIWLTNHSEREGFGLHVISMQVDAPREGHPIKPVVDRMHVKNGTKITTTMGVFTDDELRELRDQINEALGE